MLYSKPTEVLSALLLWVVAVVFFHWFSLWPYQKKPKNFSEGIVNLSTIYWEAYGIAERAWVFRVKKYGLELKLCQICKTGMTVSTLNTLSLKKSSCWMYICGMNEWGCCEDEMWQPSSNTEHSPWHLVRVNKQTQYGPCKKSCFYDWQLGWHSCG